jgi:hypothetical protein
LNCDFARLKFPASKTDDRNSSTDNFNSVNHFTATARKNLDSFFPVNHLTTGCAGAPKIGGVVVKLVYFLLVCGMAGIRVGGGRVRTYESKKGICAKAKISI